MSIFSLMDSKEVTVKDYTIHISRVKLTGKRMMEHTTTKIVTVTTTSGMFFKKSKTVTGYLYKDQWRAPRDSTVFKPHSVLPGSIQATLDIAYAESLVKQEELKRRFNDVNWKE